MTFYVGSELMPAERAPIVFENLEHVADDLEILELLRSCIMRLNDPMFTQYNVRLCLVGVRSSVKYLSALGADNTTVMNRLIEIPEVSRMSRREAFTLLARGFVEELRYDVPDQQGCF